MTHISNSGTFNYSFQEYASIKSVYRCAVLCELDAELCEVFASGGQIVSDDWHILFNVHDDRGHIRTLVTHVLHTLPRHLSGEMKDRKALASEMTHYSLSSGSCVNPLKNKDIFDVEILRFLNDE